MHTLGVKLTEYLCTRAQTIYRYTGLATLPYTHWTIRWAPKHYPHMYSGGEERLPAEHMHTHNHTAGSQTAGLGGPLYIHIKPHALISDLGHPYDPRETRYSPVGYSQQTGATDNTRLAGQTVKVLVVNVPS